MRFKLRSNKNVQGALLRSYTEFNNLLITAFTYHCLTQTNGNNRILKLIDSVSQTIGIGNRVAAGDSESRGAGDISYIA